MIRVTTDAGDIRTYEEGTELVTYDGVLFVQGQEDEFQFQANVGMLGVFDAHPAQPVGPRTRNIAIYAPNRWRSAEKVIERREENENV